jgi:hypothetical protein
MYCRRKKEGFPYEIGYIHNGNKIVYDYASNEEDADRECKEMQKLQEDEWYYKDTRKVTYKKLSIFDL